MKRLLYIALLFPVFVHAQSISIFTPYDSLCSATPILFTAFATGVSTPHYRWEVNGANAGTDSLRFVDTPANGDSVTCLLTNSSGDTVFATSNSIVLSVNSMPNAGAITGNNSELCIGSNIVLSDTATGGVWSASNNSANVINGTITGTHIIYEPGSESEFECLDTIYYSVTNSCGSDTASKIITIDTIPYGSLGNLQPVCIGQSEPLTSDDDISLDFFAVNGCAGVGYNSLYGDIVGGAKVGTDSIYYISSNACGIDTVPYASINVIGPPTLYPIIVQSTEICVGSSINLLDSSQFYNEDAAQWVSTNGNAMVNAYYDFSGIVSDSGGIVTGIKPGLDTIALGVWNECGYETTTPIVITIDPPGSIIGADSVCADYSIALSDSTPGGAWSSYNPAIATIELGTVTGISPGIDTIFYKLSNGCSVNTPVIVNPLPAPVTGDNIFCIGSEINLSDTGGGKWSTANISIATVDSASGAVFGVGRGVATISYSLNTGCYETEQVSVVNCNNDVTIFPNPVINELIIQADTAVYNSYDVINCLGQIITHGKLTQTFTEIDTPAWPAGIYIVRLWGALTYMSKLVKE